MGVAKIEMSFRKQFLIKLKESVKGKTNHYNVITKEAHDSFLKEVEDVTSKQNK